MTQAKGNNRSSAETREQYYKNRQHNKVGHHIKVRGQGQLGGGGRNKIIKQSFGSATEFEESFDNGIPK